MTPGEQHESPGTPPHAGVGPPDPEGRRPESPRWRRSPRPVCRTSRPWTLLTALLALAILHAALAAGFQTDRASTFDEPVHTAAAMLAIRGDLSVNPEHPPLWKYLAGLGTLATDAPPLDTSPAALARLRADPVAQWPWAVDALYAPDVGLRGESTVRAARYALIPLGALVVVAAGVLALRLTASPAAALAAAAFLALDPLLLAHTANVSNDTAVTLALLLTTLTALELRSRFRWWLVPALAACLTAALTTKYTGVIALPLAAVILITPIRPRRSTTPISASSTLTPTGPAIPSADFGGGGVSPPHGPQARDDREPAPSTPTPTGPDLPSAAFGGGGVAPPHGPLARDDREAAPSTPTPTGPDLPSADFGGGGVSPPYGPQARDDREAAPSPPTPTGPDVPSAAFGGGGVSPPHGPLARELGNVEPSGLHTAPFRLRLVALLLAVVLAYPLLWVVYGFRYTPSPTGALIDTAATADRVGRMRLLAEGKDPATAPLPPHDLTTRTLLAVERSHAVPQALTAGMLMSYAVTRGNPAFAAGAYSDSGFWWYFPFAALVKSPLSLVGLLAAGAYFAWRHRASRAGLAPLAAGTLLLVVATLASPLNIGLRHALPALVPLTIVAAVVVARTRPRWLLLLLTLLPLELLTARTDPLAFFNLPARAIGPDKLLADSNLDWGQDLARLAEWRKAHPQGTLYLAYWGTARPESYGLVTGGGHLPHTYDFPLTPPTPPDPTRPGHLAVSTTYLQGLNAKGTPPDFFARLRTQPPEARIGSSILVYRFPPPPKKGDRSN